jgi:pimeloyl-ACP methyl ester carboxylesterase
MEKLIFLHGALGCKNQLVDLKEMAEKHFDVYSFDFEEHGEEPSTEKPLGIELFSSNLLHFMDAQNITKANIFGYSMGGYVALYTANKFPERIGKIFTLATKFDWNEQSSKKEASMLNPEKIREKVPNFALALEHWHGIKWEHLMVKTADMMLEMGKNPPFTISHAKNIQSSCLLSIGEMDAMVSIEETAFIQSNIPNSTLKIFPFFQHPLERIDFKILYQEILNFMRK